MKLEVIASGALILDLVLLLALFVHINRIDPRPDRRCTGYGFAFLAPWLTVCGAILWFSRDRGSPGGFLAGLLLAALPFLAAGIANAATWTLKLTAPMRVRANRFQDPHLTKIATALEGNHLDRLHIQLRQPVDLNTRDKANRTLLWDATQMVRDGQASLEGFRLLIQTAGLPKKLVPGCDGLPLLSDLANHADDRSVEMLKMLLDEGVETESIGRPLIFGASLPALQMLALRGENLNALGSDHGKEGWNALMVAADSKDWRQAVYLLKQGVRPDYRSPDGNTLARILAAKAVESATRHYEREAGYTLLMEAVRGCRARK